MSPRARIHQTHFVIIILSLCIFKTCTFSIKSLHSTHTTDTARATHPYKVPSKDLPRTRPRTRVRLKATPSSDTTALE